MKLSAEVLVSRLENEQENRPLIAGLTKQKLLGFISGKLNERNVYYEQAKLVWDGESGSVKEI